MCTSTAVRSLSAKVYPHLGASCSVMVCRMQITPVVRLRQFRAAEASCPAVWRIARQTLATLSKDLWVSTTASTRGQRVRSLGDPSTRIWFETPGQELGVLAL